MTHDHRARAWVEARIRAAPIRPETDLLAAIEFGRGSVRRVKRRAVEGDAQLDLQIEAATGREGEGT